MSLFVSDHRISLKLLISIRKQTARDAAIRYKASNSVGTWTREPGAKRPLVMNAFRIEKFLKSLISSTHRILRNLHRAASVHPYEQMALSARPCLQFPLPALNLRIFTSQKVGRGTRSRRAGLPYMPQTEAIKKIKVNLSVSLSAASKTGRCTFRPRLYRQSRPKKRRHNGPDFSIIEQTS